jgi:hypothetical protein
MLRKTLTRRVKPPPTPMARGDSPYTVFLQDMKGKLNGVPFLERGKKLAAAWHAVPPSEKMEIAARAKACPAFNPVPKYRKNAAGKLVAKRVTKPRPWTEFVKANYTHVMHLPNRQRLAALADLYRKAKK